MAEPRHRLEGQELERFNEISRQLQSGQSAIHRFVNEAGLRVFGNLAGGFSLQQEGNHVFIVPNNPELVEVEEEIEEEVEEEVVEEAVFEGVGTRTANALTEAGFGSFEELEGLSDEEILAIDGIGNAGLEEIREHVARPEVSEETSEEE